MTSADKRNIVGVHAEHVSNVTSTDFPGHWPGEDHAWDIKKFRKAFRVEFHRNEQLHAEFDLIHVDAAIANAFRRIMMAEVPTLAIEHVYISDNTSVIQDEVLAHRLGLVPLAGDQQQIKALKWYKKLNKDGEVSAPTIDDTVVLKLEKSCQRILNAARDETNPDKLYVNHSVYARDLTFVPIGRQTERFRDSPIRAANPDILLAKLRPGQSVDMELHAVKGHGKDHAKFSPVATASYRLLPQITVKEPITGKAAERFKACFPRGVVEIIGDEAKVVKPRNDTVSREVLRHEEFKSKVELGRVRDHFIFSVESSGQFDADDIFLEAVGVLQAKCARLKRHTKMMMQLKQEEKEREESAETDPDAMEE